MIRFAVIRARQSGDKNDFLINRLLKVCLTWWIGLYSTSPPPPPAKKCKLDSPWLGLYLVVSLAGWAVGVQLHPDYPVLLIHCQDLKKIPQPKCLVSWLPSDNSTSSAAHLVLGASMVCYSPLGSASSTVPDSRCRQSLPWTPQPQTPVKEAPATLTRSVNSALVPRMSIHIADTHVLHPFFHHRFDVGPLRLTTITHAFNYRIMVLRDGVKPAAPIGSS